MDTPLPQTPPTLAMVANAIPRPRRTTLKLLLIAALIVLLQIPLIFVNELRRERQKLHEQGTSAVVAAGVTGQADAVFDAYRMVERALKYGVLVMALVFTAFFLFEVLGGLRLHTVHYVLVGVALALFYLALLALGEVMAPEWAYVGAAVASSALIVSYSAAVLHGWGRAGGIAAMLVAVHSVLYVVLRMEAYALLAGTGALFAALGLVMFFTRKVDWDADGGAVAGGAR